MDKTNNTKISRLFITFGIIGLIISTIDILYIVFPLQLANTEWIFNSTQNIINSLLAPALCIILLLAGIYIREENSLNKPILILEKITSIATLAFGLLLCANLLFYSLSIKSYQTSITSSIQSQSDNVLKQLEQIYQKANGQISESLYKQKTGEIKQKTNQQIKYTQKALLMKSIKIIMEAVLYIALFFLIGIFSFSSAKNSLLKLKFLK